MLKKLICVLMFLLTIPSMAINKKTNSKKTAKKNVVLNINNDELDDDSEEPENFDDEYEHDEEYIKIKADELKQEVFNDYEAIDNIILYEALMGSYEDWKGTRYKWGGDSKSGIDCSALTRRVYRDVFNNYELPRISVDQIKSGTRIPNSELKPGDLLYFRPRNRVNHVGVYVGNSLFINASSSKGVVLSSLNNSYWKKYYKYAVRVNKAREMK